MKRVFTNGCFDLFHIGHLELLRYAKSCGDYLTVGVNSDASVRRLKGPQRPIIPEAQRLAIVRACQYVDQAILFEENTPDNLILDIRPHVIVKYSETPVLNVSTTEIIERIVHGCTA